MIFQRASCTSMLRSGNAKGNSLRFISIVKTSIIRAVLRAQIFDFDVGPIYDFKGESRWERTLDLISHWSRHRRMIKAVSDARFVLLRTRQPKLTFKYLNPRHIAAGLSSSDRASAMIHHYGVIQTSFDKAVTSSIFDSGATLWEYDADVGRHTLTLVFSHPTDNEGELTIQYSFEDTLLHVLSFTLVPGWLTGDQDNTTLLISRVQGFCEHREKARVAMKSLQGLSASALLIAAAQGIALALGLKQIVGVSASRQVCNSSEGADLRSAYDVLFTRLGGFYTNGYYALAIPLAEKTLSETKSSNRARVRMQRELKRHVTLQARQLLQVENRLF